MTLMTICERGRGFIRRILRRRLVLAPPAAVFSTQFPPGPVNDVSSGDQPFVISSRRNGARYKRNTISARLVAPAVVLVLFGCGGPPDEDISVETSALGPLEISSSPRAFISGNDAPFSVARTLGGNITEDIGTTPMELARYVVNVEATSSPTAFIRHDGRTSIWYVDVNGHVHEITTDTLGGDAHDTDLANAGTYAPIAKRGMDPVGCKPPCLTGAPTPDVIGRVRMARGVTVDSIIYVGADNHIIELMSNSTGVPPYLVTDITRDFTGVTSGGGSAFPHGRADGTDTIYYIASDNHIHEMTSNSSISWQDWDLYWYSGEVTNARSDPWAYTRSDGVDSVVFEASDSRIHELSLEGGYWWHSTLPSVYAKYGLRGRPTGYVRRDGVSAVVYVGFTDINKPKYSLHELTLRPGVWTDSTLPIGAEVPQGQPFGLTGPSFSSVFFRVTVNSDGQIHSLGRELVLDAWGHWTEMPFP